MAAAGVATRGRRCLVARWWIVIPVSRRVGPSGLGIRGGGCKTASIRSGSCGRVFFCKSSPPLSPTFGSTSNVSDRTFHSLHNYPCFPPDTLLFRKKRESLFLGTRKKRESLSCTSNKQVRPLHLLILYKILLRKISA